MGRGLELRAPAGAKVLELKACAGFENVRPKAMDVDGRAESYLSTKIVLYYCYTDLR